MTEDVQPVFIDTNVLIRHLTGDPPAMARRATAYLRRAPTLLLVDVVVAEVAYVLRSLYGRPRADVAGALRALLAMTSLKVVDRDLLQRTIEVYEHDRLGFADAYLVASAERSGVGVVVSFDTSIDRAKTIQRIDPA